MLFDLLEPWNVRVLSIRKTADLPLQLWGGTFPRFVAIGFYFLSERVYMYIMYMYVKIVLYSSVTPLFEGKMVMNE